MENVLGIATKNKPRDDESGDNGSRLGRNVRVFGLENRSEEWMLGRERGHSGFIVVP